MMHASVMCGDSKGCNCHVGARAGGVEPGSFHEDRWPMVAIAMLILGGYDDLGIHQKRI